MAYEDLYSTDVQKKRAPVGAADQIEPEQPPQNPAIPSVGAAVQPNAAPVPTAPPAAASAPPPPAAPPPAAAPATPPLASEPPSFQVVSPTDGMTEAQKAAFFAQLFQKANMPGVIQYGASPTGTAASGGGGQNTVAAYDPTQLASNQERLAATGPNAFDLIAKAGAEQIAKNDAAVGDYNRAKTLDEVNRAADEFAAGPGAFRGEERVVDPNAQSREDFVNRHLKDSGLTPLTQAESATMSTQPTGNRMAVPDSANINVIPNVGSAASVGNTSSVGVVSSAPATTPLTPTSPGQTSTAVDAAASTPGASITPFGPGSDLLSSQITPAAGPNRGDIAQGYLDAFDTRAEPMLRDKIRAVGQRAAQLGRLGMGDTAVEALNPYTDYLKERAALSSELASRSAEGQIGDERSNRGELRTERDFQNQSSQQAIANAIQQWLMQQQARQQDFNNGATLGNFGYNNSPANLLFGAGGTYGQGANAAWDALGQYLTQWFGNNQTKKAA